MPHPPAVAASMLATQSRSSFCGQAMREMKYLALTWLLMTADTAAFKPGDQGALGAAVTDFIDNGIGVNGPIDSWDTSDITGMSGLFASKVTSSHNWSIANWNTHKVTGMAGMFIQSPAFNSDIGGWNVAKVKDFTRMFQEASSFNSDISKWNTASVTDMNSMFSKSGFNSNIESWNVAKVVNMLEVFGGSVFNQALNKWDISSVTSFQRMFYENTAFNQPLDLWDVSNVGAMQHMFYGATAMQPTLLESWTPGQYTIQQMFCNTCAERFPPPSFPSWYDINIGAYFAPNCFCPTTTTMTVTSSSMTLTTSSSSRTNTTTSTTSVTTSSSMTLTTSSSSSTNTTTSTTSVTTTTESRTTITSSMTTMESSTGTITSTASTFGGVANLPPGTKMDLLATELPVMTTNCTAARQMTESNTFCDLGASTLAGLLHVHADMVTGTCSLGEGCNRRLHVLLDPLQRNLAGLVTVQVRFKIRAVIKSTSTLITSLNKVGPLTFETSLMSSIVGTAFHGLVVRVGTFSQITTSVTFMAFECFNEQSCMFSNYIKDRHYKIHKATAYSSTDCATDCWADQKCEAFESLSGNNWPYSCAFWMNGACNIEEMSSNAVAYVSGYSGVLFCDKNTSRNTLFASMCHSTKMKGLKSAVLSVLFAVAIVIRA